MLITTYTPVICSWHSPSMGEHGLLLAQRDARISLTSVTPDNLSQQCTPPRQSIRGRTETSCAFLTARSGRIGPRRAASSVASTREQCLRRSAASRCIYVLSAHSKQHSCDHVHHPGLQGKTRQRNGRQIRAVPGGGLINNAYIAADMALRDATMTVIKERRSDLAR